MMSIGDYLLSGHSSHANVHIGHHQTPRQPILLCPSSKDKGRVRCTVLLKSTTAVPAKEYKLITPWRVESLTATLTKQGTVVSCEMTTTSS